MQPWQRTQEVRAAWSRYAGARATARFQCWWPLCVASEVLPPAASTVLFITDPGAAIERVRLDSCGAFTRADGGRGTRRASEILDCDRLADVAAKLGVSLSTVRTLLQRAFDKTDTHRQSELVRLMLSHRLPDLGILNGHV